MKSLNTILQKIHPAKEITLYTNLSPAIVTQRLTNETYYNEAVIKIYGWLLQHFRYSRYLFLGKVSGHSFIVRRMLQNQGSKNPFIPLIKGRIVKDGNEKTTITTRFEFDMFQKFIFLAMLFAPVIILRTTLIKNSPTNEILISSAIGAVFMLLGLFLPSMLFKLEFKRGKKTLMELLDAKEAELKK